MLRATVSEPSEAGPSDFHMCDALALVTMSMLLTFLVRGLILYCAYAGHCCFLDGPSLSSWSDRVIVEYCIAAADTIRCKSHAQQGDAQASLSNQELTHVCGLPIEEAVETKQAATGPSIVTVSDIRVKKDASAPPQADTAVVW